jgi:hypothetical protein
MLRIRIVSVGAMSVGIIAAIAVALVTNIAAAQTATDGQVGKPLALLAGLRPPHDHKAQQTKATVHAKTASAASKKTANKRTAATTKSARKEHHRIAAKPAAEPTTPAVVQTDTNSAPPAANTFAASVWPLGTAPADAAPAPSPGTVADDGLKMSAVVVDGQTVQVASPDQVNAIDLAADDNRAAKAPAPADRTDAKPTARAVFAAPVHRDETGSPVGSASWIAQVLAALGGAAAAGTVAWFLIGGGPQRMMYG